LGGVSGLRSLPDLPMSGPGGHGVTKASRIGGGAGCHVVVCRGFLRSGGVPGPEVSDEGSQFGGTFEGGQGS
jgi:hypothetical protein